MNKIEHVVFDIGSVLIHWDPELVYLDLIPERESRQSFLQDVCSSQWNIEQDRGRDWTEAENVLIDQYPHLDDLIRAYRRDWIKSIPHAFEDVVAIYSRLIDSGRDVTLLTNFNQDPI